MEAGSGRVDNLAALATLDEKSLLEELRMRYGKDIIYTYIGDILIAFNPYQPLPIYGVEFMERYTNLRMLSQNKPHIFSISDTCYQSLRRTQVNQCCVVSGESGAGKTETTKLMVQHIAHLCQDGSSTLHEKIVQVNPLLEAFGNAQTLMNNNSSRFGKYIELQFDPTLSLNGARISEYVLEKSRVVGQGPGERNFHIFYYMFAGLDQAQLQNNLLNRPENHRILRTVDGAPIYLSEGDFRFHRDMWDRLTQTMDTVGFLQEEMNGILAILAAILMVTDIVFEEEPEIGGVYIRNEAMLEMGAELLGVLPEELASALISNISFVRGEQIVSLKNVAQANDGRDALAKALYGRLFGWIVRQINLMLQPNRTTDGPRIGILDIAGFENFKHNSFEQLCINACNEQLQYYFNQHIFQWELDEYKRESVKGKDVKFNDNRPLVDLFLESHVGVFSLMDEESRFPRGSDLTLLDKLSKTYNKKSHFTRAKGQSLTFTIQHYAGPVVYNVTGFLEKNRDHLSWNLLDCMKNSEAQFVVDLFFAPISETGSMLRNADVPKRSRKSLLLCKAKDLSLTNTRSLSKQAGKKLKRDARTSGDDTVYVNTVRTLGTAFKNSLTDLMAKLLDAEPHFIRCIRPNGEKRPCTFTPDLVRDQLKYTGVLETVKIRRQGFATRLPHQVFIERYKFVCFPLSAQVPATGSTCNKILKRAQLKEAEIGKTKVFLKYWHPEQLQLLLTSLQRQVVHVQRQVRGFLARRRVGRLIGRARDQLQRLEGFCHYTAKTCEDKHFQQTRLMDEDVKRAQRLEEQREADVRNAQRAAAAKRKKGLYQATPIILGNPVLGNPNPVTIDPSRPSQRTFSPPRDRSGFSPNRGNRGFSPDRGANTGYQQRALSPQRAGERGREPTRTPSNVSPYSQTGQYSQAGQYSQGGQYSQAGQYSQGGQYSQTGQYQPPGPGSVYGTAPQYNGNSPSVYGSGTQLNSGYRASTLQAEVPPPGRGARGALTPKQNPDFEYETSSLNAPASRRGRYEHTKNNTSHYARRPPPPTNTPSQSFTMNLFDETVERFQELDTEVWGKVFYMEKSTVLGKVYLREREVIVDDSKASFDGKVIGLKAFANPGKNSDVTKILKKIGKGIKLSRDGNGNVFATRLSEGDIVMKGYKNPEAACYPQEIIEHMGRLPKNKPMKIFCMNEYKSHIALELQKPSIDQRKLQGLSMVSFAFVRNTFDDLDTPCWVTVINFSALDVLGNERVLQEVKQLAHLSLTDVDEAQLRRNWARLQHRRGSLASQSTETSSGSSGSGPHVLNGGGRPASPHYSDTIDQYNQYASAMGKGNDSVTSSNVPTNKKNWAKLRGRDSVY